MRGEGEEGSDVADTSAHEEAPAPGDTQDPMGSAGR